MRGVEREMPRERFDQLGVPRRHRRRSCGARLRSRCSPRRGSPWRGHAGGR
jgi:hypothetical protein